MYSKPLRAFLFFILLVILTPHAQADDSGAKHLVAVLVDDSGSMCAFGNDGQGNDPNGNAAFAVVQLARFLPDSTRLRVYTYGSVMGGGSPYVYDSVEHGGAGRKDRSDGLRGRLVGAPAPGAPHPYDYGETPCSGALSKMFGDLDALPSRGALRSMSVIYLSDGCCNDGPVQVAALQAALPSYGDAAQPRKPRFYFVRYNLSECTGRNTHSPDPLGQLVNGAERGDTLATRTGGRTMVVESSRQSALAAFEIFAEILDHIEGNHATHVINTRLDLDLSQALGVNFLYASPCKTPGCGDCQTLAAEAAATARHWEWPGSDRARAGSGDMEFVQTTASRRFCWIYARLGPEDGAALGRISQRIHDLGEDSGGRALIRADYAFGPKLSFYRGGAAGCGDPGRKVENSEFRDPSRELCVQGEVLSLSNHQVATKESLRIVFSKDLLLKGFPVGLQGALDWGGERLVKDPEEGDLARWRWIRQDLPACFADHDAFRAGESVRKDIGFSLTYQDVMVNEPSRDQLCFDQDGDGDGVPRVNDCDDGDPVERRLVDGIVGTGCAPDGADAGCFECVWDYREGRCEKAIKKIEDLNKACKPAGLDPACFTGHFEARDDGTCPCMPEVKEGVRSGQTCDLADGYDARCFEGRRAVDLKSRTCECRPTQRAELAPCEGTEVPQPFNPDCQVALRQADLSAGTCDCVTRIKSSAELPDEVCDGVDNDCDGEIDEDFPQKCVPCWQWALSRDQAGTRCQWDPAPRRHEVALGDLGATPPVAACPLAPNPDTCLRQPLPGGGGLSDAESWFRVRLEAKKAAWAEHDNECFDVWAGDRADGATVRRLGDHGFSPVEIHVLPKGSCGDLTPDAATHELDLLAALVPQEQHPEDPKGSPLEKRPLRITASFLTMFGVAAAGEAMVLEVTAGQTTSTPPAELHLTGRFPGEGSLDLDTQLSIVDAKESPLAERLQDFANQDSAELVWTNCSDDHKGYSTSVLAVSGDGNEQRLCLVAKGLAQCKGNFLTFRCKTTGDDEAFTLRIMDLSIDGKAGQLSEEHRWEVPVRLRVERGFTDWFLKGLTHSKPGQENGWPGGWLWIPILLFLLFLVCRIRKRVHTFQERHRIEFDWLREAKIEDDPEDRGRLRLTFRAVKNWPTEGIDLASPAENGIEAENNHNKLCSYNQAYNIVFTGAKAGKTEHPVLGVTPLLQGGRVSIGVDYYFSDKTRFVTTEPRRATQLEAKLPTTLPIADFEGNRGRVVRRDSCFVEGGQVYIWVPYFAGTKLKGYRLYEVRYAH